MDGPQQLMSEDLMCRLERSVHEMEWRLQDAGRARTVTFMACYLDRVQDCACSVLEHLRLLRYACAVALIEAHATPV